MHSPLKRLVVPVVVVFALAIMTGFFAYFVVAPAPVSQPATLVAPPAGGLPSTVGQARATDTVDAVDRLRPSDEDIVKAFQQATEDRKPMETPRRRYRYRRAGDYWTCPATKKPPNTAPVISRSAASPSPGPTILELHFNAFIAF